MDYHNSNHTHHEKHGFSQIVGATAIVDCRYYLCAHSFSIRSAPMTKMGVFSKPNLNKFATYIWFETIPAL